jgi:hypothetical protein
MADRTARAIVAEAFHAGMMTQTEDLSVVKTASRCPAFGLEMLPTTPFLPYLIHRTF